MQRVLITGITGRIGSKLFEKLEDLFPLETSIFLLEGKTPIILPVNSKLKLQVKKELDNGYDLAIHLAANSDTTYCQKPENRIEVREDNINLTRKVCEAANRVILLSTDYVFNGNLESGESFKEDEKRNPVNYYGQTKLEAEDIVLSNNGIVIRIDTMMGTKNKIIDTAKRAIEGEDYFPFWTNNLIRPSYFTDFFKVLKKLVDKEGPSIYHVSCNGDALSRSEMAQIVLDIYKEKGWKRKMDDLKTESLEETKRFVLDTQKTKRELGVDFIDSREAVRRHVLEKV